MVGNGSYKLAFIAYFSQGLINSFWKLEHISLAGVVVSFSTFLFVPPLAFLDQSFADFFVVAKVKVSTFIFHHTGRLQMTFLWNLGLKNNHQWCRLPMPTLQLLFVCNFVTFFRAFIPLTLHHRHIQVQGTKNSGMGCLAEMFTFALSMETWTLSRVWYFGVNCGLNGFLLLCFFYWISVTSYCTQYCVQFHLLICVSFLIMHLLCCIYQFTLIPICSSWCPFVLFPGVSVEPCCNMYINLVTWLCWRWLHSRKIILDQSEMATMFV